eukprot:scaffold63_cov306-Pinguiococcus_pyrenoidosus.AAC.67
MRLGSWRSEHHCHSPSSVSGGRSSTVSSGEPDGARSFPRLRHFSALSSSHHRPKRAPPDAGRARRH